MGKHAVKKRRLAMIANNEDKCLKEVIKEAFEGIDT